MLRGLTCSTVTYSAGTIDTHEPCPSHLINPFQIPFALLGRDSDVVHEFSVKIRDLGHRITYTAREKRSYHNMNVVVVRSSAEHGQTVTPTPSAQEKNIYHVGRGLHPLKVYHKLFREPFTVDRGALHDARFSKLLLAVSCAANAISPVLST